MPETMALLRLAVLRHRWLLLTLGGTVALGQCIALMSISPEHPTGDGDISIFALAISLLPAAIASIVLFDYGHDGDMATPDSGCSPWLLRMPIADWKIAVVPVLLKTAWISALWLLFVHAVDRLGVDEPIPRIAPCFAFSASAISILVITWRPYRSGWGRLAALMFLVPIIYLAIGMVFVAPSIKQVDWRPLATQVSLVGSAAFYIASVGLIIRSTRQARTAPQGIIPSGTTATPASNVVDSEHATTSYRGPFHALLHLEFLRVQNWVKRVLLATALPLTLILVLFCKLSILAVVAALIGFAYFSLFAVSRSSVVRDAYRTLPPYLAASPLRTSNIAWARFLSMLLIATVVYSLIGFVFLGWACWAENREIWLNWAADRAAAMGSQNAISVGVRWSLLIVIAWPYVVLSRLAAFLWIDMIRRPAISVLAAVGAGLAFLVPLMAILIWFMKQTNWETTQAEAIGFLDWIPGILIVVLSGKLIAAISASVMILRDRLVSVSELLRIYGIWLAIVILAATVMVALIPDPKINDMWVIGAIIVLTPLCRVLLMPLGLARDRHR